MPRVRPACLLVSALSSLTCVAASGQPFSRIFVLGDSLSDTGNVFGATVGIAPASPPHSGGRFTNGPVWHEIVSDRLGLPRATPSRSGGANYAYGGVTTGSGSTYFFPIFFFPNAGLQVDSFVSAVTPTPTDLVVLWAGGNDFFGGQADPSIPARNLRDRAQRLINDGVRNLVVPNLPLLGETPRFRSTADRPLLNNRTRLFNDNLDFFLEPLSSQANFYRPDVEGMFGSILANPGAWGFSNVTGRAFNGSTVVPDPDSFLFWDEVHPTRVAHRLLGDMSFELITTRRYVGRSDQWSTAGGWSPGLVPDVRSHVVLPAGRLTLPGSTTLRRLTVEAGTLVVPGGVGLAVSGPLEVEADGTLELPLTQAAAAVVAGTLDVAGAFRLKAGAAPPLPGQVYELVRFTSLLDSPTLINGTGLPGLDLQLLRQSGLLSVALSATGGDANLDDAVDFADLLVVARNYNQPGTWIDGDFTFDSLVDFSDLLALARNYAVPPGRGVADDLALAVSLVPDPTLAWPAAWLLVSRRRRVAVR